VENYQTPEVKEFVLAKFKGAQRRAAKLVREASYCGLDQRIGLAHMPRGAVAGGRRHPRRRLLFWRIDGSHGRFGDRADSIAKIPGGPLTAESKTSVDEGGREAAGATATLGKHGQPCAGSNHRICGAICEQLRKPRFNGPHLHDPRSDSQQPGPNDLLAMACRSPTRPGDPCELTDLFQGESQRAAAPDET
jgi:hypothetical protein